MTDIATRIERVCNSVLAKEQEYREDRETISNRSALLRESAIHKELIYEYIIEMCYKENVKADAVFKILA
jgi:hypothetical protein